MSLLKKPSRRFWLIVLMLPLLLAVLAWAGLEIWASAARRPAMIQIDGQPPQPARRQVLFIAMPNVPKGKFHQMARMAAPHGIAVDSFIVPVNGGAPEIDPARFMGYDAIFLDLPARERARTILDYVLPLFRSRYALLMGGSEPLFGGGFEKEQALPLISYYDNGGERNLKNFFTLLAAALEGDPTPAGLPPPIIFPKSAVYHPKAPDLVFASVPEFLKFKGLSDEQIRGSAPRPPVVAISIHQEYISGMQTAFIDDLVERVEKLGAIAMPIYDRMLPAGDLARMLRPFAKEQPDSEPLADAIISMQITLNAEGRRKEFESLGLPIIQSTNYRDGDEAAWRADPHGMPMASLPFYMTQPEMAGVADIQIASAARKGDDALVAIPGQMQALAAKAINLIKLQRKPNADKRLALIFWNHPGGEKNISSAGMNIPRSLISATRALRAAGYDLPEPPAEEQLIERLQRLLAPGYRKGMLPGLVKDKLAALLPVSQYRRWMDSLPEATRQAMKRRWGEPEQSEYVIEQGGRHYFVIPRLQMGKLDLLPLMGRSDRGVDKGEGNETALYHSTKADALPPHSYMAAYLWVREGVQDESENTGEGEKQPAAPDKSAQSNKPAQSARPAAAAPTPAHDALIHFGTHGTQEWLPGKERGLNMQEDPPMLAVGDIPVVYPYIMDNVAEAIQAKRRGRAVIVSHQTPAMRPAGLHESLGEIHDLLHKWMGQDEGAVKEQLAADLLERADKERLIADMGWTPERARAELTEFVDALHAHLHELAQTVQPIGLHTFGRAPTPEHQIATAMLMLGDAYQLAAARHAGMPEDELDEALVTHYEALPETPGYRLLAAHIESRRAAAADKADKAPALPAELQAMLEQGYHYWQTLNAEQENQALIRALAARYIPPGTGGDPVRSPDGLPTGRNLYGFDPTRVPIKQAWEAGKKAGNDLIEAHRKENGGKYPTKIAFSLWSLETMRHQGLLEAQALWLMGVEPVWNAGGRVESVRLIPRKELGRPRVDVVLSATGLYRDHFPNLMEKLALAAQLASNARDEEDNAVAAHTERIAAKLRASGMSEADALDAAQTRIFSSESGRYGTGVTDAAFASDGWDSMEEGDRKLAQVYLSRMQYAYGPDKSKWGSVLEGADTDNTKGGSAPNLYAEHLRGTDAAVLSRTSNLYGMLTSDDPFQFLGGIGMAVRHLDGKAPKLYISNLRKAGGEKLESAAQFLSRELATRQFHPGYIKGLMAEGYAGTLQVQDATDNLWGWTAVAREIVRDDQWQEMMNVYVRDKHQLGLDAWFEKHNPHAQAKTIERMVEAIRKGYWQADNATLQELKTRYVHLAQKYDVISENATFTQYVNDPNSAPPAPGFGLDAPAAPADAAPPPAAEQPEAAEAAPPEDVRGMELKPVPEPEPQEEASEADEEAEAAARWQRLLTWLALLALMLLGAAHQSLRSRRPLAIHLLA